VTEATHAYRALVQELANTQTHRDSAARDIEKSYVDGCSTVARAVTEAAQAVGATAEQTRAAATLVTDADADAATLWKELGRVVGRSRAVRLGPLPLPDPPPVRLDPAIPLTRAADLISAADATAPRRVPASGYALLALLGAGCAAAVAVPAKGLLLAFSGSVAVTVLAQLMIFIAPFVGLPVARAWVRRQWRTRLEFGGFVLTALGGMLTCCSLVALL
jgi:hypothetical protein